MSSKKIILFYNVNRAVRYDDRSLKFYWDDSQTSCFADSMLPAENGKTNLANFILLSPINYFQSLISKIENIFHAVTYIRFVKTNQILIIKNNLNLCALMHISCLNAH